MGLNEKMKIESFFGPYRWSSPWGEWSKGFFQQTHIEFYTETCFENDTGPWDSKGPSSKTY